MKQSYFLVLLAICWSALLVDSQAQKVEFTRIGVDKGLSQETIYDIEKDEQGNLWIATMDGLNRFDGYSFQVYKQFPLKENWLTENRIRLVKKGRDNKVFSLTSNNDLNCFIAEKNMFVNYGNVNTIDVRDFMETRQGDILFAGREGLYKYNTDSKEIHRLFDISTNMLYEVNDSLIWMLTDKGLYEAHISRDKEIEIKVYPRTPYNALFKVSGSEKDGYVFAGNRALYYKPANEVAIISFTGTFAGAGSLRRMSGINGIGFVNNTLWMGTTHGLYQVKIDRNRVKINKYTSNPLNGNSISHNDISDIYVEPNGNVWIATYKKGLNFYDYRVNQFEHFVYTSIDQLEEMQENVRAMLKTPDGDIWFGFENKGLGVIKDGIVKRYKKGDGSKLVGDQIRCIFQDSENTIWVGSKEGIQFFDPNKTEFVDLLKVAEPDSGILASFMVNHVIKEFMPGRIVFGTSRGFFIYDKLTNRIEEGPAELKGFIRDIEMDKNGNYWLVKDDLGLIRYNPRNGRIDHYRHNSKNPKSLINNKVYSIKEDRMGNIWVATNSGLDLLPYRSSSFRHFSEQDGLSNSLVYSLQLDKKGNVWASTNKGLNKISQGNYKIVSYLENKVFVDDASTSSGDGELFFGGPNSIIHFYPHAIRKDTFPPQTLITSLYLANQEVHPGDSIEDVVILNKSVSFTDKIILPHSLNSFSFDFVALTGGLPGKIKYRYRLDNYQKKWIYTRQGNRRAVYINVPPGEYIFEVLAANEDDVWASTPARIKVIITPPFWQESWFKILGIGLLILLFYLFYLYRVISVKRRNKELEKQIEVKTSELVKQNTLLEQRNIEITEQKNQLEVMNRQVSEANEAKLRFFTNVSHEFRTPLTLILGNIDLIRREPARSEEAFNTVTSNINRLLRLISQILDFRKIDQDQMDLLVNKIEIKSFVSQSVNSFRALAAQRNITLKFKAPDEPVWLYLDLDKIEKVLYNLLSNAFKYTPIGGKVTMEIRDESDKVSLLVKDSGQGISEEEQEFIFDRFFRSKDVSRSTWGYGIGLALTKSLVEVQKGTISMISKPTVGSSFIVTFEKGKEQFKEEEIANEQLEYNIEKLTDVALEIPVVEDNISGQKPLIMIVEDNMEIQNYLGRILGSDYDVAHAINGVDALNKLKHIGPELIISDVMMPEMDGITFVKELKKNLSTSHIPVILLTARSTEAHRIEGYELGVDDYIEKPFKEQVLLTRINGLLLNRKKTIKTLKESIDIMPDKLNIGKADKEFLNKINTLIEENIKNADYGVEELGNDLGMSRATFYRKFTALTGQSTVEFIRTFRLKRAAKLLQEGNLNISEVSYETGFSTPSYFRKCFKKHFNVTPKEFQKGDIDLILGIDE